jgi:hypothetical protein
MNRKKCALVLTLISILILGMTFSIPRTVPQENAQLVLNNDFSPSETTYTNITMDFTDGDPYNGHSVWTYTVSGVQGATEGFYAMDCDSGEYTFFGVDEFVNNSIIMAEVEFSSTEFSGGTYHYVPLGYFYQKTTLETNTHWALALYWDASGLRLYYNTGNGDTPSYTTLNTSTPKEEYYYTCFLYNLGTSTYVRVIDITPAGDGTIYDGYVTTPAFDATALYAGFGEYSTSGINTWSRFDDFILYDTHFTNPTGGTGISLIDAYLDEAYAHTFYDVAIGYNSTLELDPTVTNITLVIQCWLNGTACDVATFSDGASRIRHNVTVINTNGTVVFSQENFTYSWGIEYSNALFIYQYWVELDFTPVMGEIYTVTVTYEVYY